MHIHELTICSPAIPHWKRCQSAYNARANDCHRYRIFEYDMLFLFYIFHGGWPCTYVIICNLLCLVLWDYTECLNLAFGESRFAVLSLQRRHMSVMGHKSVLSQYYLFNTISWLTPKKHPNSLTGNVIFITNSCTYEITHADVWVCRSSGEIVLCFAALSLQWRYMIERHGVPNLRPHDKLLYSTSWLRPKETPKRSNLRRNHLCPCF